MERARKFTLSVLFVGGLLIATAALGVSGALFGLLQDTLPADAAVVLRWILVIAFAAVVGFALGVTQVATASAQMLHQHRKGEHALAYGLAWACAGLCACVSIFGVHIGGQALNGEATIRLDELTLIVAGGGLAFVKPAMSFVTEACRAVERERVAVVNAEREAAQLAHEAAQRDADRAAGLERDRLRFGAQQASEPAQLAAPAGDQVVARMADHRPKRPPVVQAKRPASAVKTATKVAAATVTALGGAAGAAAADQVAPVQIEQAAQREPECRRPTLDEIEDARLALARENAARVATGLERLPISQNAVARKIGVRRCDIRAVWPVGASLELELN